MRFGTATVDYIALRLREPGLNLIARPVLESWRRKAEAAGDEKLVAAIDAIFAERKAGKGRPYSVGAPAKADWWKRSRASRA